MSILETILRKLGLATPPPPERLFIPDDTSQRNIEGVIQRGLKPNQVQLRNILHAMAERKWKAGDVIESMLTLKKFEERFTPSAEAYSFLERAIETNTLVPNSEMPNDTASLDIFDLERNEIRTPGGQFKILLEGVALIESTKRPELYELFNDWHGGDNLSLNSVRFATDVKETAAQLRLTKNLPKKALDFFLMAMKEYLPKNRVYGVRAKRLAASMQRAHEKTPDRIYQLCDRINEISPFTSPELFGELVALPVQYPKEFDAYMSKALDELEKQDRKETNLRYIHYLAKQTNKLLQTHKPKRVGGLFKVTDYSSEELTQVLKTTCQIVRDVVDNGLDIDSYGETIIALEDARFYAGPVIESLEQGLEKAGLNYRRFRETIEILEGKMDDTQLIQFAIAFSNRMQDKEVSNIGLLERCLTQAAMIKSKRLVSRVEVQQYLQSAELCPEEVIKHYESKLGIRPLEDMLIIRDQGNWQADEEAIEAYHRARLASLGEDGFNQSLIKRTASLIQPKISDQDVAILGMACGNALSEKSLATRLEELGYEVDLHLYDLNVTMLRKAYMNCFDRDPKLWERDVRGLSYEDLPNIALEKQIIIAFFGKTPFNMEEASFDLIDNLAQICRTHYHKGLPPIIIIEGDYSKNLEYYQDPGSEEMHLTYIMNRLGVPANTFSYNGRSTYAVIPCKGGVEFFFMAGEDKDIGGSERFKWLKKGHVIRIGESKIITQAFEEHIHDTGFDCDSFRDRSGSVMLMLTPNYKRMLDETSTARRRAYTGEKNEH